MSVRRPKHAVAPRPQRRGRRHESLDLDSEGGLRVGAGRAGTGLLMGASRCAAAADDFPSGLGGVRARDGGTAHAEVTRRRELCHAEHIGLGKQSDMRTRGFDTAFVAYRYVETRPVEARLRSRRLPMLSMDAGRRVISQSIGNFKRPYRRDQ